MDVIYTDNALNDVGILQGYSLDVDVAENRDFEIKVPIDHVGLTVGGYVYINGQEYGGRIDKIKVDTNAKEIIFSGRDWRGILASKIVCPPDGEDYRILNGSWRPLMQGIFDEYGLSNIFLAEDASPDLAVSNWKVDRYVTVLDMINKLLDQNGYRINLYWSGKDGKVRVGALPIRDLTDSVQYETDDHVGLVVEDNRGGVNHLICLGQGDLAAREVVHLYCTATGGITENEQYYTGPDEIVDVFEDTSAEDRASLKEGGFNRLKELKNSKAFSATVDDYDVQIGDIVGGVERVTGMRVAAPVTNIIFKISGTGETSIEYKVGEDT